MNDSSQSTELAKLVAKSRSGAGWFYCGNSGDTILNSVSRANGRPQRCEYRGLSFERPEISVVSPEPLVLLPSQVCCPREEVNSYVT